MSTIVNLKVKKEDITQNIPHEIESLDIVQFQRTLKVFKDILEVVQNDESLTAIFNELMNNEDDEQEINLQFVARHALGAFELLLENVPEKAFELAAAASGIKLEILKKQKIEVFFDIFDAVVEENDIERIVFRAKKSFDAIKSKLTFTKKKKLATAK